MWDINPSSDYTSSCRITLNESKSCRSNSLKGTWIISSLKNLDCMNFKFKSMKKNIWTKSSTVSLKDTIRISIMCMIFILKDLTSWGYHLFFRKWNNKKYKRNTERNCSKKKNTNCFIRRSSMQSMSMILLDQL